MPDERGPGVDRKRTNRDERIDGGAGAGISAATASTISESTSALLATWL
jgi:hypothetical protein